MLKEPLSLPRGSVRAVLALMLTGVCSFLWATGQPVPAELLVTTSGVVAYYFATRDGELPAEQELPEPFVADD